MVTQAVGPIRTVLRWQLIAIGVLMLPAAFLWGLDGALSVALGGMVNVVAGAAYGWRISRREAGSAGEAIATLFGAWGIKVLLIVVGLVLVLLLYKDIVHAAFLAAFVVTVGLFSAAIAIRTEH